MSSDFDGLVTQICWELADPIVADPVAQDNDKRKNTQICTEIPDSILEKEGTKPPNIRILSLSWNWVSDNWVYRLKN